MEKPIQPPQDLIDLCHCGVICKIEYDEDLSEENRAEAEYATNHSGSYEWECVFQIEGRVSSTKLCHPDTTMTTITESTLLKYLEPNPDPNRWGFWQVTKEGRKLVEDWERWLRSEDNDLKEWKRLSKKFKGVKMA